MKVNKLDNSINTGQDEKLNKAYIQFEELLNELSKRELPDAEISAINIGIEEINSFKESEKGLRKLIRKTQSKIITLIEKELKLVPKNHYRNTWLALGMSAFGVPIGVAFGASSGNMGLLGLGLPIGIVIGMLVGTRMDKKAVEEGRQLDIEIK